MRKRPRLRRRCGERHAPDRYLTHAERMAVRTSAQWVAGYPRLVAQWHPTRNNDLYPYEVSRGSGRRIWWKCPKGSDHEWIATPNARTGRGEGCPFCAGQRVSVTNSLATIAPEIAKQWHPTKNHTFPAAVTAHSGRRAWWRCPAAADHVWQATVCSRLQSAGCPFCSGKRLAKSTSLAARRPDLARQLHPTRNRGLSASRVLPGSRRHVWWQCPGGSDHVWRAAVAMRTRLDTGCPFCAKQRVSRERSLAAISSDAARFWDRPHNGGEGASKVSATLQRFAWWRCPQNQEHRFQATVRAFARNPRCPYCAGRRASLEHSLATHAAGVAAEWHPTRNGPLTPSEVTTRSARKVWWKCLKGPDHEWSAPVSQRARGAGCPFCLGRALSVTNSLSARAPDVARLWHPKRNGRLSPDSVVAGSNYRAWWQCDLEATHVWNAQVRQLVRLGSRCPRCARPARSASRKRERSG
jgi:hypothetical protein